MKVVVTGSASHLAAALLPQLVADARIDHVIGVDLRETHFRHPRFAQFLLDIRSPQIERVLAGVDAMIHLAFVVMPGDLGMERDDRDLIREINIAGGKHVFTCAARQGVKQLVHLSTAAVYSLPARDARIDESHPRKALPGFEYAQDKVLLEEWLDQFAAAHPATRVIRLRPHVVLGRRAQPLMRRMLQVPFYVHLTEPQPLTQCVHEDDVARAMVLALFHGQPGAFNLACADAKSFRDMQKMRHAVTVPLPFFFAKKLFDLGWRVLWGTEPSCIEGVRYSVVLDTKRARTKLGWQPRYDSVKAVLAALNESA